MSAHGSPCIPSGTLPGPWQEPRQYQAACIGAPRCIGVGSHRRPMRTGSRGRLGIASGNPHEPKVHTLAEENPVSCVVEASPATLESMFAETDPRAGIQIFPEIARRCDSFASFRCSAPRTKTKEKTFIKH